MHSYVVIVCFMFTVLFNEVNCHRLLRRHFKHRRNQPTMETLAVIPLTMPVKPVQSQMFSASAKNQYPEQTYLPQGNYQFSPVYFGSQPESGKLPSENSRMPQESARPPPTWTGSVPEKDGLLAENAGTPPGSAGYPSENARFPPENAGLSPRLENVPSENAGIPSGNVGLPSVNPESPSVNGELSNGNTGLSPGNSGLSPGNAGLSPGNADLLHGNSGLSQGSDRLQLGNARFASENKKLPSVNDEILSRNIRFSPLSEFMLPLDFRNSFSNENLAPADDLESASSDPPLTTNLPSSISYLDSGINAILKRRKKDASVRKHKRKKPTEKTSPEGSAKNNALSKNNYLKRVNDYLGSGIAENNATFIPISKGLQIKATSKHDGDRVKEVVNITSSTERFLSTDNATEIENMVEMHMEKKIEDEKGTNKGSEEVRILETEHVKPVRKWNGLSPPKRKRKSHNKRFIVHRRNKRSKIDPTKTRFLNSVFNKIARRFPSAIRRSERGDESHYFLQRKIISSSTATNRRNLDSLVKKTKDDYAYDRREVNDFMKFFLKQMKMFGKSQENDRNSTAPLKYLNTDSWRGNNKSSEHKTETINEKIYHPEHMNIFMKLNITWDTKITDKLNTSRKIRRDRSRTTIALATTTKTPTTKTPTTKTKTTTTTTTTKKTTTISPDILTNGQSRLNLVYTDKEEGSEFLSKFLLFSMLTFFFVLFIWVVQGKLIKLTWMNNIISERRRYRFYPECQNNGREGQRYVTYKNVFTEDYPQLEWQSENGDWLPEKETDFK